MDKIETMIRGELTRKEKVKRLINKTEVFDELEYKEVAYKTDEEIDDMYDEEFNKVTQEEFEGFVKCWECLDIGWVEIDGNIKTNDLRYIKKKLGL